MIVSPIQFQLNSFLTPLRSEDGTTLSLNGVVYSCTGTCTPNAMLGLLWGASGVRSLSAANGKVTKVATFSATVTATKKTTAKLKPLLKKSAKAPVGTYFLVSILKNKADASQRYGFAVKSKSVKAPTKATKPAKPKKKTKK
jgi:hypothetical protein